jgi:hypothetical protein
MNVHRFIYERLDALVLDGTGMQPDPELAARNLVRAREAIKKMGDRWCLYNPRPPIDIAACNEQAEQAANSYTVEE